jgi:hypothetical protein
MIRIALRVVLVAVTLVACATRLVAAPTTPPEDAVNGATHSTRHVAPAPAPSHANLPDETPCPTVRPMRAAPAPAPHAPASPSVNAAAPSQGSTSHAPASESRGERREAARPVPNAGGHLQRPSGARAKSTVRSSPATPGMGLLLRIGTSAGRELSWLQDDFVPSSSAPRSGRAPPRASPNRHFARDPLACAAALTPLPGSARDPLPGRPTHPKSPPASSRSASMSPAEGCPVSVALTVTAPERPARSPAFRSKGAAA